MKCVKCYAGDVAIFVSAEIVRLKLGGFFLKKKTPKSKVEIKILFENDSETFLFYEILFGFFNYNFTTCFIAFYMLRKSIKRAACARSNKTLL